MTATVAALFGSSRLAGRALAALEAVHPPRRTDTYVLPVGRDSGERFVGAQVGALALRGAAIGSVALGIASAIVATVAFDTDSMVTAAIAGAMAVSAGPFFGALCGFAIGTHRWEQLRAPLADLTRGGDRGGYALAIVRTQDPAAVERLLVRHAGQLVHRARRAGHAASQSIHS